MSKKHITISAILFAILLMVSVFGYLGWKQLTIIEYRQLPGSKILFAEKSTILSVNWFASDKIVIQNINFGQERQPVYIGDVSLGKVAPLVIRDEPIFGFSPVISPDGKYLAFDWNGIKIIRLEENDSSDIQLAYTTSSLAWSHDGNYLAFIAEEYGKIKIYTYDLKKKQVEMKFEVPQSNLNRSLCCALAWSANDQKMAIVVEQNKENSTHTQSDIYILTLKNNLFVRITNTANTNEEFPIWSPKEDILLFVSTSKGMADFDGKLVLASGDGLCQLQIPRIRGIRSPVWSPDGTKLVYVAEGGVYYFDASVLEDQFNLFRKKCNITK